MEKYEITEEMIYGADLFDAEAIKKLDFVSFGECDAFAKELAQACVVLDPDGITYEAPDKLVHENYLTLKYFTNADVSQWSDYEGRLALFDFCKKNCLEFWSTYLSRALDIYESYYAAMSMKHRHVSSLSYKIGKAFESVLGDGDIVKNLAESKEVNEKLIDMLAIFEKAKENETPVGGVPLTMFAKK